MLTILIAEDEQALAKALRLKFTSSGFTAEVVENGNLALARIKESKFDMVLIDLLMPELDGWEVLKVCKELKVKTMVISNLGQSEDMERALNLGAIKFIVKSETSLSDIVNYVIAELGE